MIGSYQAFELNSLCFNFDCLFCVVKFVGFNRTAALFVGFCCEGLLAFFSCLVATIDLLLSTAIAVLIAFSVVVFIFTTKSKLKFARVSCFAGFSFCHLHFGVKI